MAKKSKSDALMNKATDRASAALKGVDAQHSTGAIDQFNSSIDKASELASAKNRKKK
jgi:hypothetical protein